MVSRVVIALCAIAVFGFGCQGGQEHENKADERPGGTRVMRAEVDPCTLAEPCEEAAAEVESIPVGDPRMDAALIIDARESDDFASWSYPGARSVVYDFLEPPSASVVHELAAKDVPLIIVYGDGDNPDTGESLARDLARYGVPNVYFFDGGAPALRGFADSLAVEGD